MVHPSTALHICRSIRGVESSGSSSLLMVRRHVSTVTTKRDRLQQEVIPLSHRWRDSENRKLKWHRRLKQKKKKNEDYQQQQQEDLGETIQQQQRDEDLNEVQKTVQRVATQFTKNIQFLQNYFIPSISLNSKNQIQKDSSSSSSSWSMDIQTKVSSYLNPRLRNRVGPKMDFTWWFYNILVALSPAVGIALLCEYYQDEMKEFYTLQQEHEKQRFQFLFPDTPNEVFDTEDTHSIHTSHSSSNNNNNNNEMNGYYGSMTTRILQSSSNRGTHDHDEYGILPMLIQSLPLSLQHFIQNIYSNIYPQESSQDNHIQHSSISPSEAPSIHPPSTGRPLHDPVDSHNSSISSSSTLSLTKELEIQKNNIPPTLESLWLRIQQLEHRIESSQQQQQQQVRDRQRIQQQQQQRMEYQVQRKLNQSGIRNRFEDQLIDARMRQQQQQEEHNDEHHATTMTHSTDITSNTHVSTTNSDQNHQTSMNNVDTITSSQNESSSSSSSSFFSSNSFTTYPKLIVQYMQGLFTISNDKKKGEEDPVNYEEK